MRGQLQEDIGRSNSGDSVHRTSEQQRERAKKFREEVGIRVTQRTADLGEAYFPSFGSAVKNKNELPKPSTSL